MRAANLAEYSPVLEAALTSAYTAVTVPAHKQMGDSWLEQSYDVSWRIQHAIIQLYSWLIFSSICFITWPAPCTWPSPDLSLTKKENAHRTLWAGSSQVEVETRKESLYVYQLIPFWGIIIFWFAKPTLISAWNLLADSESWVLT